MSPDAFLRLIDVMDQDDYRALTPEAAVARLALRRHLEVVPTAPNLTWRGIAERAGIAGMLRLRAVAESLATEAFPPDGFPGEDASPEDLAVAEQAIAARPAIVAALTWMEPSQGGLGPGNSEVRALLDLMAVVGDLEGGTATAEAVALVKAAGERLVSDAERLGLGRVTGADVRAARRAIPATVGEET